jgi:hypothetical protein
MNISGLKGTADSCIIELLVKEGTAVGTAVLPVENLVLALRGCDRRRHRTLDSWIDWEHPRGTCIRLDKYRQPWRTLFDRDSSPCLPWGCLPWACLILGALGSLCRQQPLPRSSNRSLRKASRPHCSSIATFGPFWLRTAFTATAKTATSVTQTCVWTIARRRSRWGRLPRAIPTPRP